MFNRYYKDKVGRQVTESAQFKIPTQVPTAPTRETCSGKTTDAPQQVVSERALPATGSKECEADKFKIQCNHSRLELYVRPCRRCTFCNCGYTHLPQRFPSVLVRSLDKQIVQLSSDLVRASNTLRNAVEDALGKNEANILEEDDVILERGVNEEYRFIKGFKIVNKEEGTEIFETELNNNVVPSSSTRKGVIERLMSFKLRNTTKKFQEYMNDREFGLSTKTLYEIPPEKVLVLFDLKSEEPTYGVMKDTWLRLECFVSNHLDDVDRKLAERRREREFREQTHYIDKLPEDLVKDNKFNEQINTFQYQDWEEEFFNIDTVQLLSLHQANQELLIWDLYFAIEKWLCLYRGFPRRMVNGVYDIFDDPDFDKRKIDRHNVFGLNFVNYPNKYRRGTRNQLGTPTDFLQIKFKARWWNEKFE